MGMVKSVADEVDAPGRLNRIYLIISFYLEPEPGLHIFADVRQQLVERRLVRGQDHQVVSVPEIIPDTFNLLDPMVESGEIEVGEILTEVISDRQARGAVDDLIQEP